MPTTDQCSTTHIHHKIHAFCQGNAPLVASDYKAFLGNINHLLNTQISTTPITQIVALRSGAMDAVLVRLFHQLSLHTAFALFGVGGYGRGDLAPYSDVDILLLHQDDTSNDHTNSPNPSHDTHTAVSDFVAMLWDIGINPAIAVRTLADGEMAVTDHTIATALLEARFLSGRTDFADLPRQWVKNAWTATAFFKAKISEAKSRYLIHQSTEYNLEPNLKTAPGGLRDIHIILWLGKFYFDDVNDLYDLVTANFLSQEEADSLSHAQHFFWQLRHHLHQMNDKAEDRLLFSYQRMLAIEMKFGSESEAKASNAPLEAMMHQYYRHAMTVAALSELLCDLFYHRYILPANDNLVHDTDLNQSFGSRQIIHHDGETKTLIFAKNPQIFAKNPASMLQLFALMGSHDIKHIEPQTLQMLRLSSRFIPDYHHADKAIRDLFLANLAQRNYLFHRLRLMKRHGVLGNYLPHFGRVMGLMQYDLFHRYTVDAHTLLLLRILHRIETLDQYGLATGVYRQIVRKDLLIIAALFHDLAKGLGGDHSQLGATLALDFCQAHGLAEDDTSLVVWLVQEHLTMSNFSQKKDITDPEVIDTFATLTADITHLNHLYVLTVADMNATNAELYNSWRATLLQQLYMFTYRRLHDGNEHDSTGIILANRQKNALALLAHHDTNEVKNLWQRLGKRYLLNHGSEIIAWHTDTILTHESSHNHTPLIALSEHNSLVMDATQVLIYTPNSDNLFAKTVAILDNFELSVLAANILTDKHNFALDSYVVVDRVKNNNLLQDPQRCEELIHTLQNELQNARPITPKIRHHYTLEDNKLKYFDVPTQIHLNKHPDKNEHSITIVTKDRAGLLAKIGTVFSELGVWVHGARIMTLGERAEDIFYISDKDKHVLDNEQLERLKQALIAVV